MEQETGQAKEESPKQNPPKRLPILSLGKKEKILLAILAVISAIWLLSFLLNPGYVYWQAIAGALTMPFLLAAIFVDNLPLGEGK